MKRWLLILLSIFSCKKIDDQGYKTYVIRKGSHRSTFGYKRTWDDVVKFSCIFDNSAKYETEDPVNQADINKLYGLSDCGDNHMNSSIRLGWRWYNDSLEIHWFRHVGGQFSFGKICEVEIDVPFESEIIFEQDDYIISVDGTTVAVPRGCGLAYNKYYLYPYFGGDEKAPHDIKIKIKE